MIRPISLYTVLVAAPLLALPLATQMSPSVPTSFLSMRGCAVAIARAEELIDKMAGRSGSDGAGRQLELARNMMDQQDEQGCVTSSSSDAARDRPMLEHGGQRAH